MAAFRLLLVAAACMAAAPSVPAAPRRAAADDPGERTRAGILRAEDERDANDPVLRLAMAGRSAELRERAVIALGRIGDSASVPLVAAAAADASPAVRRAAAFALGEIESPEAFGALSQLVIDRDPELRALAAEALAKIAWPDTASRTRAGRLVVTRLLHPKQDRVVAARAARASWRFGAETAGLADALAALYTSEDAAASEAAAYAASRLGTAAVAPLLELAARDERPAVRASAARGLGRVARLPGVTPSADQRAILVRRAFDVDPIVRIAALAALEAHAPADDAVTADFLSFSLHSGDPALERAGLALVAAWKLASQRELVRHWLASPWRDLVPDAALALAAIDGAAAVPDLAAVAASRDWTRRASVAAALAAPELATGAGRELQDRLLADPDPRVVAPALESAFASGRDDAAVLALAHASATDVVVRAVAAAGMPALVGHGMTRAEAADALRRTYREAQRELPSDARLASLEALSQVLGADAQRDLALASTDPDLVVRLKAASLAAPGTLRAGSTAMGRPFAYYLAVARDEIEGSPRTLHLDTERGAIEIELFPSVAPMTVRHLARLANSGFYDGQTFHRVVPAFVAQGGDPRGDGWGGPDTTIRCEVSPLGFTRGTAGMALSGKDTGGSQFFVALTDQPHLDGGYTVFGRVTPGSMKVVDALRRFDVIRAARVSPEPAAPEAERQASRGRAQGAAGQ